MINPFTLVSTREVYNNPWIQVREDIVTKNGKEGLFGVVNFGDGVTILALDSENNAYCVQEYKYALSREDINLPGGAIDAGESPLESAKRELFEELGIEANTWIELSHIHPITTIYQGTDYLFLARDIILIGKSVDSWEETRLIKIPYQKVLEMVMNSEITHGASVAGILKAQKYIS